MKSGFLALVLVLMAFVPAKAHEKAIRELVASMYEEAGAMMVKFDFGPLESGMKIPFKLRVRNELPVSFPIHKMETSCGCWNAATDANEIPAKGELVISGSLDVVKSHEAEVFHLQVYLPYRADRPGEGLTMLVDYSVAGMISFKGTASFLTTAGRSLSEHRFQVPILVTAPLSLASLQIEKDEEIDDLKVELVEKDGSQFLICTCPIDSSNPATRVGKLLLKSLDGKKSSSVILIVEAQADVRISPSIARFVPVSETKLDAFRAKAIVSIHPEAISYSDEDRKKDVEASINCTTDQGTIESNSKHIGVGLYSILIDWKPNPKSLDENRQPTRPKSVELKFSTGIISGSKFVPVMFMDRL